MASESTDSRSVSLDLPATLDEWLTERATEMGVEREELVVQLVSSYQVAAEAEEGATVEAFETAIEEGVVDIEVTVREVVEETLQEAVDEAVAAAVEDAAPGDREIAQQVEQRIDGRLESLEAEIEEKLDDIRRRVVQVKQEADSKAPADHEHEAFDRLDDIERQLSGLSDQVGELESVVDESSADGAGAGLESELEDVQSKLNRLARIVVRLRDEEEGDEDAEEALARIKRTAAREGFDSADCGACGESVTLSLLTEPACPHCDSQVRDVVPGSGGLFGAAPRLTGAPAPDGDPEAGNDE